MFGRPANNGGANRPVCKFFLEGRCKFGENCKNEHPRNQGPQQQANRFASLQNPGNTGARGRVGGVGVHAGDQASAPFSIYEDLIKDDLTTGKERPIWPLSAYGPGVKAPRQLLEGAVEVSPEEMRVQCYLAQAAGKPQEYAQQEEAMLQQMNQQIQAILNDLPGAKKYVIDGQDQHPNRNDMVVNPTQNFPRQNAFATNPTGANTPGTGFAAASSGFGAPSALGTVRPAFGAQSVLGQTSGFGAPSSLGPAAGFGKASALGSGAGNAFGKPSPFGQPSSLGQNASPFGSNRQQQQPNPFGQTPAPSSFGQPSALRQPGAFGTQNQQSQPRTAFGQPSAFGASANQSSPFAQAASNNAANASPFAQAASNSMANGSPFAQAGSSQLTGSSPFGQAAQTQSQPSPFAQAGQNQNAASSPFATSVGAQQGARFGTPSTVSNPFGATATAGTTATTNNNLARPGVGMATSSPFARAEQVSNRLPGVGGNNINASGAAWHDRPTITDEKGNSYYEVPAPTKENPHNVRRERIWHPTGAPANRNADTEGLAGAYTGELGQLLEKIYAFVRNSGAFGEEAGGVMPEIPPKREWISWDL